MSPLAAISNLSLSSLVDLLYFIESTVGLLQVVEREFRD